MGVLLDRIEESMKGNGDLSDNFKKNTLYFSEKYTKSDNEVESIRISRIEIGRFYFFDYEDESNWVKWSPVFTIGFKKFDNLVIIRAINLNLIPLEIRAQFFDQFIREKDLEQDISLGVDETGAYNELLKISFEYSIMEYNAAFLNRVHRISMMKVPNFLYSGYYKNKYDPNKIMDIWVKKQKTRVQRHQEMSSAVISDFYKIDSDIDNKYDVLRNHILRIQRNLNKYR
jgi:hypothetical protein